MVKTELNEERDLSVNSTAPSEKKLSPNEDEKSSVQSKKSESSPVKSATSGQLQAKSDMKSYVEILNLLKEYNLKFISSWTRTYNFQKWKTEHHPKCAYYDSGSTGSGSIEFYKEMVSVGSDLLGLTGDQRVDPLRERGQIQRHAPQREETRQRRPCGEPFRPHLQRGVLQRLETWQRDAHESKQRLRV